MYEMQLTALSVLADNSGEPPSCKGWENLLSYVTQNLCTNVLMIGTEKGDCHVSTAERILEQD